MIVQVQWYFKKHSIIWNLNIKCLVKNKVASI